MGCLNYTDDAIPFSLPLKVNGMARDYSIVSSENDMQTPVNLITEFKGTMYESYGSVWYHQINNQTTDDVYVYTHISSGMEFNDPSKACLSRLLQTSIKLRLLDLDVITKESGTEKYVRNSKNQINNDSRDSDNINNINNDNNNNSDNNINDDTNNKESKSSTVIPYKEGTSEALRRILNKAGIKKAFKHHTNSIRNKLCRLKDPVEPTCSDTQPYNRMG
ncbi:unnamed protein product [Trichobilharzia regenti]|nr:unnamed protein product [Trichobilharzia regenti]